MIAPHILATWCMVDGADVAHIKDVVAVKSAKLVDTMLLKLRGAWVPRIRVPREGYKL